MRLACREWCELAEKRLSLREEVVQRREEGGDFLVTDRERQRDQPARRDIDPGLAEIQKQ